MTTECTSTRPLVRGVRGCKSVDMGDVASTRRSKAMNDKRSIAYGHVNDQDEKGKPDPTSRLPAKHRKDRQVETKKKHSDGPRRHTKDRHESRIQHHHRSSNDQPTGSPDLSVRASRRTQDSHDSDSDDNEGVGRRKGKGSHNVHKTSSLRARDSSPDKRKVSRHETDPTGTRTRHRSRPRRDRHDENQMNIKRGVRRVHTYDPDSREKITATAADHERATRRRRDHKNSSSTESSRGRHRSRKVSSSSSKSNQNQAKTSSSNIRDDGSRMQKSDGNGKSKGRNQSEVENASGTESTIQHSKPNELVAETNSNNSTTSGIASACENNQNSTRPGIGLRKPSLAKITVQAVEEEDDDENDGNHDGEVQQLQGIPTQIEKGSHFAADEAGENLDENNKDDEGLITEDGKDEYEGYDFDSDDGQPSGSGNEADDDSDADTVMQFDPSQDSGVHLVRQVSKMNSNLVFESSDGTRIESHISEIVDPIGNKVRNLRGSNHSKGIPDFLSYDDDDDSEEDDDDALEFNDSSNAQPYLAGGEQAAPSLVHTNSDTKNEGDLNAETNPETSQFFGGEEELKSAKDTGTDITFSASFIEKDQYIIEGKSADFDSCFPSDLDPATVDSEDEENIQHKRHQRRKVKRKVIKKKSQGTVAHEDSDEENQNNMAEERKRRRRKTIVMRKTSKKPLKKTFGKGEDNPEESVNYDTDFSLDNVVENTGKLLRADVSIHEPLSSIKVVNNLYTSISVEGDKTGGIDEDEDLSEDDSDGEELEEEDTDSSESNDDDDDDDDDSHSEDEANKLCRPPLVGEVPFTFSGAPVSPASSKSSSSKSVAKGISNSIGRYFSRTHRPLSRSSDGDDVSVSSRSSISNRLFRVRKKHQLLGDDDSCGSGSQF